MPAPDMIEQPEAATNNVTHNDLANSIRALTMDAVQRANSGHPGMPMGMADVATVLFTKFLKFDPQNPKWPDRDRFVLSAGHGSMLLYSLLYLTGYEDMTIEQIKNFRQLGSITAGHPEYGHASGVETTTGPLGQGLGNAVGMALTERLLAARFGDDIVDHHTYVIAGDGCMMEGISHEAASLAGHLKLSKLIVLFDDNGITIDGSVDLSDSTNVPDRFLAYGWNVLKIDGHAPAEIENAIAKAQNSDRPTLIACKTTIGYGAPSKAGTAATHGAALGDEEVAGTREKLNWPYEPFDVPASILETWRNAGKQGASAVEAWKSRLGALSTEQQQRFNRTIDGELGADFSPAMSKLRDELANEAPALATRQASQRVLETINQVLTETIGGSADLTGSNNTRTGELTTVAADSFDGRFIHYGIRELGMAAIMNGMALHGGVIPYSGMFLVFSDYARPAIRLAALMEQRVIHVMTHDSIGLGEDGPTHQPVEHLSSLRAMPNLNVFRPADAVETAECWELALKSPTTPSVLALTRQKLPALRTKTSAGNESARGAYEIASANGNAKITLLATGSEVHLALSAKEVLDQQGVPTRVVSMPCQELFDIQDAAYQEQTLGPGTIKVAVEAAVSLGWEKYIGPDGGFVGMSSYGGSAPHTDLYKHFGITSEAVAEKAKSLLT